RPRAAPPRPPLRPRDRLRTRRARPGAIRRGRNPCRAAWPAWPHGRSPFRSAPCAAASRSAGRASPSPTPGYRLRQRRSAVPCPRLSRGGVFAFGLRGQELRQLAIAGDAVLEGKAEPLGGGLRAAAQLRVLDLRQIDELPVVAEIVVPQLRMTIEAEA